MRLLAGSVAAVVLAAAFCAGVSAGAQEEAGADELDRGAEVYAYWCATCHSAGPNMPGTQALAAKYDDGRSAVLTERVDLTPDEIAFFVRNGVSVMPPFRKTEVTDADLAALSAYIVETARVD